MVNNKGLKYYDAKHFNNLKEMIEYSANKYENNVAFMVKNKQKNNEIEKITYKEFKNHIDSLGTKLINMNLKGKRVAIIANNCYEWAVSYLAVINGVGIIIPLDKGLPVDEIILSLERSKADVIIFDSKHEEEILKVKEKNNNIQTYICIDETENNEFLQLKKLIEEGNKLLAEGNKDYINAEISNETMSVILFTSGTTSKSKAVMLSHKNIAENIYSLNCREKIYETDVSLAFLPFHHTFGLTGLLFFLSNGTANAFCDGLRHIQKNLKEYNVSIFVGVPLLLEAMHKKILQEIEKQGKTKLIKTAQKVSRGLLKIGIDVRRKIFKQIIEGTRWKFKICSKWCSGN